MTPVLLDQLNSTAMKSKPFFSVIMPIHNKLPHLQRSITSVLKQSYINFEMILVDDASSDGSEDEVLMYDDPRIRVFRRTEPGPGGYAARNLGIRQARHDWLCFLDAGDEWEIDLLETVKHTIEKHEEVECVSWGWTSIMENKKWLDETSVKNRLDNFRYFSVTDFFNQRHSLWTGAVAFRRSLIQAAGAFPEAGFKRGGDVDTWIRCLARSKSNIWINKKLATNNLDAINMVTKQVNMDASYVFTPFIVRLTESSDQNLVNSIKRYQNEKIFSVVRAQILAGEAVDYDLVQRMNPSPQCLLLVGRLIFNELRYKFKALQHLQLRRTDAESNTGNQFFRPLYDFDE